MEDEQKMSPDIPDNHTNTGKEEKQYVSIFSVILLVSIFVIVLCIILNLLLNNLNTYDVKGKAFTLSDDTMLLFLEDDTYILSYKVLNEEVLMKGKYKVTFGDDINENVKYEYGTYMDKLSKDNYVLGFIELQNEDLYINGEKAEIGYINTYYIVRSYFDEDNNLIFNGYDVDTGVKVKLKEQKGEFDNYLDKIASTF